MTQNEFMRKLAEELKRRNVTDAEEIEEEYREHFAFKLKEGHSEEEIAARLGNPIQLAAQFEQPVQEKNGGKKAVTMIGLYTADFFAAVGLAVAAPVALVLAAAAVAFAGTGVCLILQLNPWGWFPQMPYASALILGLALLALCVLTACGCVGYASALREAVRRLRRFNDSMRNGRQASRSEKQPRRAQALRWTAKVSAIVFAALLISGMAVSMALAGAPAFWHVWNWFV